MARRKDNYIFGLDIGTRKTCAVIAEVNESGGLDIIGIGMTESKGLRRGIVVNLEATVEAIRKVIEEAELMAGVAIESAYVGIAGNHIKGFNSRGVIAVGGKSREITREDVQRVIEAAKAVSIPPDREILHVLPQEFIVDDQDGIGDPIGMTGTRLEVNVHIVTTSVTSTQNLIACVNRSGMVVADMVLESIASSETILTPDEKELGVALIDIGGGTTDLAIFEKGSICYTSVVPIGGDSFTNDISVGLRTPIPEAEKIKKRYGCALSSMVEDDETIEVPSMGGRKPRILSRQILCEIIQPRAEETFNLVHDEIKKAGYERSLNSGIVLTGGGALLEGMPEIAEQIFDLPVRRGSPTGVGGLVDVINNPIYSTAVGLLLYGHRNTASRSRARGGENTFSRLKTWIREFI